LIAVAGCSCCHRAAVRKKKLEKKEGKEEEEHFLVFSLLLPTLDRSGTIFNAESALPSWLTRCHRRHH